MRIEGNVIEYLKKYNIEVSNTVVEAGVMFDEHDHVNDTSIEIQIGDKSCKCIDYSLQINSISMTEEDNEDTPMCIIININKYTNNPEAIIVSGKKNDEYGIIRYLCINDLPIHLTIGKTNGGNDILMIMTNNAFTKYEVEK